MASIQTIEPGISPKARYGLLFGLLSMLGPFAIDFYLPAFPEIAQDLHARPATVQLTLAAYIGALALSPLLYGTLSDRLGRRPILFTAMSLFAISSILCALATSIEMLIVVRVFQGLGACGMTVMSRAMVRDLARDHVAAKLMALSFLVQSISPLFAPVVGGLLLTVMPWRVLFVIIFAMTIIVGTIAAFSLPETHGAERRPAKAQSALSVYRSLLGNHRYVAMCAIAGCATAGGFGFLTAAPFILSHIFGQPSYVTGVLLAAVALVQVLATQLSPSVLRRFGLDRHMAWSTLAGLLGNMLLVAVYLLGLLSLPVLICLIGLLFGVYGLLLTPAAVGALDASHGNGGAAAALLATIQLALAASGSFALSVMPQGSLIPLLIVSAASAVLAAIAAYVSRIPFPLTQQFRS